MGRDSKNHTPTLDIEPYKKGAYAPFSFYITNHAIIFDTSHIFS